MRIDKLLTSVGLASRTEAAKAAKQGLIKVNGTVVPKADVKVDPDFDTVEYMGSPVVYKKHIYIMLNKPSGVVSSTDGKDGDTVSQVLNDESIIELYFQRDENAITETNRKYGSYLFTIANTVLHCEEDSHECVNDTYIGVWNAVPPTRPKNLMSFVCKITRNLSLKRLEARARQKRSAATISLDELAEILPEDLAI